MYILIEFFSCALPPHLQYHKVLLECGAPADAPDVDLGWSPLVWAAHFGHADACLALLHGGACFEYQAQVLGGTT